MLNYGESLRIGLEGLRSHKMRSSLTMLGIIFGVSAVIAMLSIGEGARQEVLEQISALGINNVIVYDHPIEDLEEGEGRTNLSQGLSMHDALALEATIPLAEAVYPVKEHTLDVQRGSNQEETKIVATLPGYDNAMNLTMAKGGFFNYSDVLEHRRVCVVGASMKRRLFYFEEPLGQEIKIGSQWFTVAGILEKKARISDLEGKLNLNDVNESIFVPVTTASKRFSREPFESELDRIVVRVRNAEDIRQAAGIIKHTLDRRHGGEQDYHIVIPEALLKQRQQTQNIFNIVMGTIASISLLVGGIGIMNIMLASVMERTREIGIRRAVGARQADVMGQFLIESVLLSFAGGIIGVVVGFAMTYGITLYAEWRTVVSVPSIFLAFFVSAAVGVIFGLYPARQAAMLDPIESLRYE